MSSPQRIAHQLMWQMILCAVLSGIVAGKNKS